MTRSTPDSPIPELAGVSSAELVRGKFLRLLLSVTAGAAAVPALGTGLAAAAGSADPDNYLATSAGPGRFPLVAGGRAAPLVVSSSDHPGVTRVVNDLQADVE